MDINFYVRDKSLQDAKKEILEKVEGIEKQFNCECELLEVSPLIHVYRKDSEDFCAEDIKGGLADWYSTHDFKVSAYFTEHTAIE